MGDDPNVPKWALDPLLNEANEGTPLQLSAGGSAGKGAANGVTDEGVDSDGEYDSELSEEDIARYSGVRTVRRGCILNSFLALNAITVVVALAVAAAQGLVLANHPDLSRESIAVRCYNILFCLLIVFAELECTQSIREMSVLHSWVTRGILYSFVGVLALEEENEKGLELGVTGSYIALIAWAMVGIGILYFLMGILCLQRLRDKRMARHKTLVAHAEMQQALRRDPDLVV